MEKIYTDNNNNDNNNLATFKSMVNHSSNTIFLLMQLEMTTLFYFMTTLCLLKTSNFCQLLFVTVRYFADVASLGNAHGSDWIYIFNTVILGL